MRAFPVTLLAAVSFFPIATAAPVQPEVAELSFDATFATPAALAATKGPAWLTGVTQEGGHFSDEPRAWQVPATAAKGEGRLSFTLDRTKLAENLVATILFDAPDSADLAVQLFDGQGRVIAVDLFGNLADVGREAMTDTYVEKISDRGEARHPARDWRDQGLWRGALSRDHRRRAGARRAGGTGARPRRSAQPGKSAGQKPAEDRQQRRRGHRRGALHGL